MSIFNLIENIYLKKYEKEVWKQEAYINYNFNSF